VTEARWLPVRAAWHHALYGDAGFYRRHQPAGHFRTSVQVSESFAAALVALVRRWQLTSVCDIGAGAGELVSAIRRLAPDLTLTAVELRERPPGLSESIAWQGELPTDQTGLVFANELLDNVSCEVVERDGAGVVRIVEVEVETGQERLGASPSPEQLEWLRTWWPLTEAGQRAEVGLARDRLWAQVCAANPGALALCVDYAHRLSDRPPGGTLSSYRQGRQTPVRYDGEHDITAHVAVDSVAAAIGGVVRRQRDALRDLGVSGERPPIEQATREPAEYLRGLSRAAANADLLCSGGLGDFAWVFRWPVDAGSDRHGRGD
jgi:SAM-dependent MidA family methyltransferase